MYSLCDCNYSSKLLHLIFEIRTHLFHHFLRDYCIELNVCLYFCIYSCLYNFWRQYVTIAEHDTLDVKEMTSPSNNFNNADDDLQLNYPWINTSLFEKLLRQDYSNNEVIAVEKVSLAPALKKGENFLSQMIRAKVDYKVNNVENRMSFVIKAEILNAPESLRQNELFSREIAVFKYVIPLAEELLQRIGDDTKFSAK